MENIVIMIAYFISLYILIFWILTLLEKGVGPTKGKKLEKFPLVTVCIPAYNEGDNIAETIESVINLDYPKQKVEITGKR